MRRPAIIVALAVIVVVAMVLAFYQQIVSPNGSNALHSDVVTSNVPITMNKALVVYFSVGASPAPLQTIDYVKHGQLHSTMTIDDQVVAVGRNMTSELKETLVGLIANSTMKFGSLDAPVVVVEYLDPTCPACIAFSLNYFDDLLRYINNGTVLYVVRYFPTHVFSYLRVYGFDPPAFTAGVETWLSLECIYKKHGPDAALTVEGMYEVAAYYLWAYVQTRNSTYHLIYPIAMRQYLEGLYPDCAYNLTLDQAIAVAERAVEQTVAELDVLGVPDEMAGTPFFVVFSRP